MSGLRKNTFDFVGEIPVILFLLTFLLAGVLLSYSSDFFIPLWFAVLTVFLTGFLCLPFFIRTQKIGWSILLFSCITVFSLGSVRLDDVTNFDDPTHFSKRLTDSSLVQIRLLEDPTEKENSYGARAEVQYVDNVSSKGELVIYFEKRSGVDARYGDVYLVGAQISEIENRGNPLEFDYADYMMKQGIGHQVYAPQGSFQKIGDDGNVFFDWLCSRRRTVDQQISTSTMTAANQSIAKALLLGNSSGLDYELRSSFSSAGVMHVLAVSGLHLGIVFLLLSNLLKFLKPLPFGPFLYLTLVLAGIWFFALFTALSPSVFRAAVMFTFIAIGMQLQRETSVYQSLMVSAFVLILIDPLIIFQIGFQLSYLAVLSIVYLQPRIYRLLYVPNKWLDKGWQLMAVSLAAQLGTFPLGLYYFHQFPNYFLLSNLVVVPLVFVVVLMAVIYALTAWLPFIHEWILFTFDLLLTMLSRFVGWVDGLPYSSFKQLYISLPEMLLIYGVIVAFLLAGARRRFGWVLVSFTLVACILGSNAYRKWTFQNDRQLVFYNTREVLIDYWDGYHYRSVQGPNLSESPKEKDFAQSTYYSYRSLGMISSETYSPEDARLFYHGESLVGLIDSNCRTTIPKSLSVAYLYDLNYLSSDVMDDWSESLDYLICGPKVGFRLRNYCSKLFGDRFINLRDGAFILKD